MRYEHVEGWWNSSWGSVAPAGGSAPYQVRAAWSVASCVGGEPIELDSSSTGSLAAITFDLAGATYRDADGRALDPGADRSLVPAEAVSVEGVAVRVSWDDRGWGLNDATQTLSATCTPASGEN